MLKHYHTQDTKYFVFSLLWDFTIWCHVKDCEIIHFISWEWISIFFFFILNLCRKKEKDKKLTEEYKKKRREVNNNSMKEEEEKYERSIQCAERYQAWVEKKGKPRRGPPPPTLTQRYLDTETLEKIEFCHLVTIHRLLVKC